MFKGWDFGEGLLAIFFAGVLGSIAATILLGLVAQMDDKESVRAWVSVWWLWAPAAFLYWSRPNSN